MARTRNVYPSDMVAHLWANKSQDSARESGGRFYFVGDTIYSYGSHFPIARHVAHKGKAAVLFTTRSYSATTAGHKCMVEGACRHLTVFHVADLYGDHRKQVADYRSRFMGLVGTYAKARQRKPEILAQLRGLVSEANQYAEFFGLRRACPFPPIYRAWLPSAKQSRRGRRRGNSANRRRGHAKSKSESGNGLTGKPIIARPTAKLSGCGSRGMNCRPRAARGFHLTTLSRLFGLSNGCAKRGKPISATGTLSTLDTLPLTQSTHKGT